MFCGCWGGCPINVVQILLVDDVVRYFCILDDFCLVERSILESTTTVTDLSIFPFKALIFCFTYVAALLYCEYVSVGSSKVGAGAGKGSWG